MTAAYTESLFDVGALDEESGIIQPGQWRLSLMETANWGTFSGFTALPVDRRGLLITGHSGSGKSTLLDALATVLTPPRARRLNAAARSDANRGDDRSIVSYVRGAWRNETDDTGNVTSSFLRPNTATWSGILLRYENGLDSPADAERESSRRNEPIELIVLFNLKAGSNARDGLSTAYLIMRGRHGLKELEPYAINGIDTKGLRKEYGGALSSYNEHSSFAAQFCRLMGIRSTKTLELLHKTQAAKNFGSLDELFRKFMLEEPATFRQADDAAEQFLALSQAHEGVVKLRRQMETLEPLAHLDESYLTTQRRIARLEHLTDVVEPFRLSLLIGNLESTLQRRTRDLRTLEDNARRAEADFERANENWNNAQSALAKSGASAITQAELSANQYEQQLQQVRQLRSKLTSDLGVLGAQSLPGTLAEWERFLDDIAARIAQQETASEQTKDAKYKSIAHLEELQTRVETLDTELKHLRTHRTNVPSALDDVRNRIARELGISPRDIPFSAELMSVRPEEAAWEGALERLLESQGKTLLVAHRFIKPAARFIDRTHLGLRLDYVDVPPENEVPTRSLSPLSAVRKIAVKRDDRTPSTSEWLNKTCASASISPAGFDPTTWTATSMR